MANHRRGQARGQRGRPGTLSWREDPLIQERITLIRSLRAQGYSAPQMLGPVNELMRERGVGEVTLGTVRDDLRRLRELWAEERAAAAEAEEEARQRHIDALEEAKRQAWQRFHAVGDRSLNVSGLLAQIIRAEEAIARLDGSLRQRVEVTGRDGGPIAVEDVREELARRLERLAEHSQGADS